MVQRSLIDYIKDLIQKGYDIATIRSVLLKYGYTNKDVDDAINSIYHTTIRHEIHLSRTTVFVILFIFTSLIGLASFFYYSPSKNPKQLLDVNLEPVTTRVAPGENVVFLKELSNLGSSKRYDVVVRQEIIEPKTGKAVAEKTETRAIETFGSTRTDMQIPKGTDAGEYVLRVIVEYDDKKAVATLPVSVGAFAKNESCFDGIQNQNEEGIDCGGACNPCQKQISECSDGKCAEEPAEDETTENKTTENKKSEQPYTLGQCNQIEAPDSKDTCISNIAEAQRSKDYCKMIVNPRLRDLCYSNIAKLANDNSICEEISIDSRKDSCYMTFVLDNKDYSVCSRLNNNALRNSCDSLRQLNELQSQ